MQVFKVLAAAILAASMAADPVWAQPLSKVSGPKELPPAGFAGNQYVDSAGCVFIRAGVGGQTTWVPRVSRDRKLVCGYDPTFPPGTAEAAEAVKPVEPVPDGPAPTAAPGPASKPAPAVAAVKTDPPRAAAPKAASPVAIASRKPHQVRLVRAGAIAPAETLCLARIPAAQRYLLSDGRRVTQCAATAPVEPVAWLNGLGVPGLTVVPGAPSAAEAERALHADRGAYRVVWQRGAVADAAATGASAASAARPSAGPGAFVQVGVFAEPANAQAAIARLKSMGLPVASSHGTKGGRPVKAIMAGPFGSAAGLQAALASIRRAGYRDAYIRG